ncbi:MAG: hypothetical protein V2I43_28090, partial [Parvularcula sp.]|nr:hypothetical protein [Parvularcula sp.]
QADRLDAQRQVAPGTASDPALRPSELVAFVVAAFLIGGGILTAIVQFELLAQPLRDVVGTGTLIAGAPTADLTAAMMIAAQIVLAVVLLDAAGVTRLLPGFGHLSHRVRVVLTTGTGLGLLLLAAAGAALAYARELVVAESLIATSALLGTAPAAFDVMRPTVLAHLGLGFVLPFVFALMMVAVESCLTGVRVVIGGALVACLATLGFLCRVMGALCEEAINIMRNVYDVVIFAPLWAEKRLSSSLARALMSRTGAAKPDVTTDKASLPPAEPASRRAA